MPSYGRLAVRRRRDGNRCVRDCAADRVRGAEETDPASAGGLSSVCGVADLRRRPSHPRHRRDLAASYGCRPRSVAAPRGSGCGDRRHDPREDRRPGRARRRAVEVEGRARRGPRRGDRRASRAQDGVAGRVTAAAAHRGRGFPASRAADRVLRERRAQVPARPRLSQAAQGSGVRRGTDPLQLRGSGARRGTQAVVRSAGLGDPVRGKGEVLGNGFALELAVGELLGLTPRFRRRVPGWG